MHVPSSSSMWKTGNDAWVTIGQRVRMIAYYTTILSYEYLLDCYTVLLTLASRKRRSRALCRLLRLRSSAKRESPNE